MRERFLAVLSAFFLFASCTSKPVPIPGDFARAVRNIHLEYMNIADTYMRLEEYKNAAEYYTLAMQNQKIYWACYYKLALCYVYSSDYINAEKMFKEMLGRDPDNASLQASLAYIYSVNGNVRRAIRMYSQLLASQPDNEQYQENYLILVLSDKKFFKKYRADFETVLARMGESYPENKNLAKITEKYKEFAEINYDDIEDLEDDEDSYDSPAPGDSDAAESEITETDG